MNNGKKKELNCAISINPPHNKGGVITRRKGRKPIEDPVLKAQADAIIEKRDKKKKAAQRELAKRELARRHLMPFVKHRFPTYDENWHHTILADALERVENGSLKRLIVNMPPRHGKSELVSVNFPAWCMGKNKDRSIIAASYGADLATDFGRKVRNIMDDGLYKLLFNTRLAEDAKAKGSWATNGRAEYNAVGVGGAITGKGGAIIIVDDYFKNREDADSEVVSEKLWDWYKSTLRTRLTPDGAIVIVATRWRDNDLTGRILEEQSLSSGEPWEIITLSAIAEEDETDRKTGEALWANHYTLENLSQTKNDIGNYEFAAQYQQNPVNRETQVFKPEVFRYIEMEEVKEKITSCYITIDSALSKKKNSDSTGVTINWVDGDNVWHIKAYKVKVDPTELIQLIFDLHSVYKPISIGLEEIAMTQAIDPFLTVEMAKRNIFPNVVPLKHGGVNKETRIRGLLPRYDRGHIYHIKGLCKDLEAELTRFPSSAHDDCIAEGSMILTNKGDVAIENICVGDFVMTRGGYQKVLKVWDKGEKEVITRFGVTATPDHRIITTDGDKPLTNVTESDTLYIWKNTQKMGEKQSYIKEESIIEHQVHQEDSTQPTTGGMVKETSSQLPYTDKSGLITTEKLKKDTTSTTEMEILSTMMSLTLALSQPQTTQATTQDNQKESPCREKMLKKQTLLQRFGMAVKKVWLGTENMLKIVFLGKNKQENVLSVEKITAQELYNQQSIAVKNATQDTIQESLDEKIPTTTKRVFDLMVDKHHEFFSDGVLVHNCMDSMAYQVHLAEAPNTSFDIDEFSAQELAPSELIHSDIGI